MSCRCQLFGVSCINTNDIGFLIIVVDIIVRIGVTLFPKNKLRNIKWKTTNHNCKNEEGGGGILDEDVNGEGGGGGMTITSSFFSALRFCEAVAASLVASFTESL